MCFVGNCWGRNRSQGCRAGACLGPLSRSKWKREQKCSGTCVKGLHWKCSDMLLSFSGVSSLVSLVPVSAAVRAQDEDGAEGSTGRTDTSSSVSITNSISSCEVTKIVRMPLPCLKPSLLMWFRAFTTQY